MIFSFISWTIDKKFKKNDVLNKSESKKKIKIKWWKRGMMQTKSTKTNFFSQFKSGHPGWCESCNGDGI